MSDRTSVYVHLLPALIPAGALKGGIAVVVDVLRATTVMVHALAAGCEAIIPCAEIEEARSAASGFPRDRVVLGGERGGVPIEGFDLGNSPQDYNDATCRGKTVVMTTTNGTRAILACLEAERVGIAALINARKAAAWAASWNRPVHIVCSGTEGFISVEDAILAGELADRLGRDGGFTLENDEALIARSLYSDCVHKAREDRIPWSALVAQGRGGGNVRRLGLAADLEVAARREGHAASELMPVLKRDPIRIEKDPCQA